MSKCDVNTITNWMQITQMIALSIFSTRNLGKSGQLISPAGYMGALFVSRGPKSCQICLFKANNVVGFAAGSGPRTSSVVMKYLITTLLGCMLT